MQQLDKKNLEKFGKIVRKIREEKFSSLNKCAFQKGGITSATLSRIENGLVDFKFSTLLRLSMVLEVPLPELLKDFEYKYELD